MFKLFWAIFSLGAPETCFIPVDCSRVCASLRNFKSKTLRFVRLCSAAWLLLVQSRKIANTFSKLHWASRSDDTFCEDFFHVSISKATCKRVTLRNNTQQPTTTYNRVCKRTQHTCNIQQCCVLFARGLSRQLLAPRFLRFLSLFANSFR